MGGTSEANAQATYPPIPSFSGAVQIPITSLTPRPTMSANNTAGYSTPRSMAATSEAWLAPAGFHRVSGIMPLSFRIHANCRLASAAASGSIKVLPAAGGGGGGSTGSLDPRRR